jgi:pimeloyl-ACP methyl ester carboxylesterase
MFPDFLHSTVQELTEKTSIEMARKIEKVPILTTISQQEIISSYVKEGTGNTAIVLLHGFDSSLLEFRRLFPHLAAHHQTWAIDLLGFGFSDRSTHLPINPHTIKTHLYHLWKTLIQQPMILVAASMGGAAAIDFALTYPETVSKLVLIDSVGCSQPPAIGNFFVPPIAQLATKFLSLPRVRRSVSERAYFDGQWVTKDAEICASLHLFEPNWSEALIKFTRSGGYGSFKDKLKEINQPTLILWGDRDRILGVEPAKQLNQGINHSKLIWIKECGHVPHLEKAGITADYILNFI